MLEENARNFVVFLSLFIWFGQNDDQGLLLVFINKKIFPPKTIHWCQQQMLPIENISNLNVSFGE